MVMSNMSSSAPWVTPLEDTEKWTPIWYARRAKTGDTVYRVYEKDGFYHFFKQDGTSPYAHSATMWLSDSGCCPCKEDGTLFSRDEIRKKVLGAVPAGVSA